MSNDHVALVMGVAMLGPESAWLFGDLSRFKRLIGTRTGLRIFHRELGALARLNKLIAGT